MHQHLISPKTFEELQKTLFGPKLNKYFFPEDTRPGILKTILQFSFVIVPDVRISACRDPKDDMYLELAVSGKADCVVTGDQDLLILNPFKNIPIITPLEFLNHQIE